MKELLAKIAEALGLDKEADEKTVLEELEKRHSLADVAESLKIEIEGDVEDVDKLAEAITEHFKESKDDDEKTLKERAEAEGKTVLKKDDLIQLTADAKAGKKASEELHQGKFDTAFSAALDEVRVDAKDETRESWQKLYDKAPEETIERLAALPKLASTKARGSGKADNEVPEGVHEDHEKIDRKVKDKIKEDPKLTYAEALDIVLNELDEEAGE
jgi:hypothetical protein